MYILGNIFSVGEVVIGLTGPYSVGEGDSTVEVCALVMMGNLSRSVIVNLETQSGTADGGELTHHTLSLVVIFCSESVYIMPGSSRIDSFYTDHASSHTIIINLCRWCRL